MSSDWIFSDDRLQLRSQCLGKLLRNFGWDLDTHGLPQHSMEKIYGCAHDWVSQGHKTSDGIITYFENYYAG